MEWYIWIFQGIGTEIIMLILGLGIGCFAGYKVGINRNGSQKQNAKDKAVQKQILEINDNSEGNGINGNLRQTQKADANAEQTQIGKIRR